MEATQPARLGDFEFDAIIKRPETLSSKIPGYATEEGYSASDHICLEAVTLDVTAVISNAPITWADRHPASSSRVQSAVEELRQLWEKRMPMTFTAGGDSYENVCIRINDISTGYVSVHQYAGIPNVAGSTAYTSNWVAELFGPSNLKKSTSGFPQRLYNSVLQGALGIDKDGIFGANTEKTVKEFQSAHGLTADGIAGAKTKAALAKQL